jgi:hypothetical protein
MNDEHSPGRALKQKWDAEDAARDKQEERAQQIFLEAEANQTFAPIEDFLARLRNVLNAAGGSVEIDTTWEHLGDRRLRRVAKIIPSNPPQLPLDFTIQGVSIFYRNKAYRFTGGIEPLIQAITADVEQFLTLHRNLARS